MKASSLNELQKELATLPPKRVLEICSRLTKHKKENKELLTYLLFEAHDEESYIKNIKSEVDDQFSEMNSGNLYYVKKSLRKILRGINKFIKYSGIKETELALRIYFCGKIKESGIPVHRNKLIINLYEGQVKKIKAALEKLHEDIQFDYKSGVEEIENYTR